MRIWLHEWQGNAWGWNAWSLDYLGFSTWAPTRDAVLDRAPDKYREYREWVSRFDPDPLPEEGGALVVVEEIRGDEPAFRDDLEPACEQELYRCKALLAHSRQDLLTLVDPLPEEILDWDPPYRHFSSWAWWKTIRQILAHIALCEVGYYLPNVGWHARSDPVSLENLPWREPLERSRDETLRFLNELKESPHRCGMVVANPDDVWSTRKVLRRLVWHEVLHFKSIRRIVAAHGSSEAP